MPEPPVPQRNISTPGQAGRLRAHTDPLLQELPRNVLQDLASSLVSGVWSNVLTEGQPIARVVSHLTGTAPGESLDALVTRVLFTDIKNRCLTHAWRVSGLESVPDLIRCPDAPRLRDLQHRRQPAVFVFSHFGPKYAVAPAFQSVGVPVAMFQGLIPAPLQRSDVERFAGRLPGMEFYWINDSATSRAIHLKRAVERLQRGELVASAIDGGHGDVLMEEDFFGHRIKVGRGPAVLARLTAAPLIPVTVTWGEGWSMEFRVHEPLERPDPAGGAENFDRELTRRAVRFFDAFLRQAPDQMRIDRIARLITKPRAR